MGDKENIVGKTTTGSIDAKSIKCSADSKPCACVRDVHRFDRRNGFASLVWKLWTTRDEAMAGFADEVNVTVHRRQFCNCNR